MHRIEWLVLIAMVGNAIAFWIARSIIGPIRSLTDAMSRLAGGDKSHPVPELHRSDEVGSMAAAVQVFKDSMIEDRAPHRGAGRGPGQPLAATGRDGAGYRGIRDIGDDGDDKAGSFGTGDVRSRRGHDRSVRGRAP